MVWSAAARAATEPDMRDPLRANGATCQLMGMSDATGSLGVTRDTRTEAWERLQKAAG